MAWSARSLHTILRFWNHNFEAFLFHSLFMSAIKLNSEILDHFPSAVSRSTSNFATLYLLNSGGEMRSVVQLAGESINDIGVISQATMSFNWNIGTLSNHGINFLRYISFLFSIQRKTENLHVLSCRRAVQMCDFPSCYINMRFACVTSDHRSFFFCFISIAQNHLPRT